MGKDNKRRRRRRKTARRIKVRKQGWIIISKTCNSNKKEK